MSECRRVAFTGGDQQLLQVIDVSGEDFKTCYV
jgi:hypothetical protein